jgi:nucleoside recognition membrane protein YjiH
LNEICDSRHPTPVSALKGNFQFKFDYSYDINCKFPIDTHQVKEGFSDFFFFFFSVLGSIFFVFCFQNLINARLALYY